MGEAEAEAARGGGPSVGGPGLLAVARPRRVCGSEACACKRAACCRHWIRRLMHALSYMGACFCWGRPRRAALLVCVQTSGSTRQVCATIRPASIGSHSSPRGLTSVCRIVRESARCCQGPRACGVGWLRVVAVERCGIMAAAHSAGEHPLASTYEFWFMRRARSSRAVSFYVGDDAYLAVWWPWTSPHWREGTRHVAPNLTTRWDAA